MQAVLNGPASASGILQCLILRLPSVTGYSGEEIGEMGAFDLVPSGEQEQVATKIEGLCPMGCVTAPAG